MRPMSTAATTVKARRTSTNYVYDVEIDGQATGVQIKVVRCTARAQFYGLFTAAGERLGAAEFKSAIAAAKAA